MSDDDEYEGGYDEPVIVTASGDQHVDAFGDADDGFVDDLPHVGVVRDNGDGLYFTVIFPADSVDVRLRICSFWTDLTQT